jgi:hypothetical protein
MAIPKVDPKDYRKLLACVSLMSSPNDNEKLAAIAGVERILAKSGLKLSELEAVLRGIPSGLRPSAEDGREPQEPPRQPDLARMFADLEKVEAQMPDGVREFVKSVRKSFEVLGKLSDNQVASVTRTWQRNCRR